MKSYSCCIVSHMNLFCHFCNQLNHCSLWSNRRPGGEKVYNVFDNQLPAALKRLQFDKHLSMENVRKLITEADGYQPHLIAPEQGYRRLIESSVVSIRGPAEAAVDAVWNKTTIVSSLPNRFMSFYFLLFKPCVFHAKSMYHPFLSDSFFWNKLVLKVIWVFDWKTNLRRMSCLSDMWIFVQVVEKSWF